MENNGKIVLFQEKQIRRVWHEENWWFVVEDVVMVLTESQDVKQYIKKLRRRDETLSQGWVQFVTPLSVETEGGKQKMSCATMEGLFRIIQSIPSPKAEPFKRWLAKVGYERIQEIENPELAAARARQLYKEKGYSDEWIEMRLKSIEIRQQLTDEWKERGVTEGIEYSILTAEISRATFGLTPSEYKDYKGLKRENLRDHMTNLELIFTMLGEETTKVGAIEQNAQGFDENRIAALEGGTAAGDARVAYENRTGKAVVTEANFLPQIREAKKK